MDLIEKHINDYDYFLKIIQDYKYIELDIIKLYCCTYYCKKIYIEINPSLILLSDKEGLLINKETVINTINEMYNKIYNINKSLSITSKIYKIYFYRIEAEKSLSLLPSIEKLNNTINEYYYSKINNT